MLFLGVPSFLPFLMGSGLALIINYGRNGSKTQIARIKAHAPNVLPLVFTITCAGIFLGILSGTGMSEAMAQVIIDAIPTSLGKMVHIVMGIFSIPLSLVFDSDVKIMGFLPILVDVAANYGIDPVKAGIAMAYGHNYGVTMCMTSAGVYFGLALYGLEYGEALRYGWWRRLLLGVLVLVFGAIAGVI
jgi:CitMHS family citrate-Mg2+:H+ or citrate-Ca2+:H+ symporter